MTEHAMERKPSLPLIPFLIGAGLLAIFCLAANGAAGAQLKPETVEAFDRYIQSRELQMNGTLASENNFSWLDTATGQKRVEAAEKLPRGEVVTEALEPANSISVPGGLIHDWIGIVFIPGATLPQTLALLQDYDHAAKVYAPDVEKSKLLSHSGKDFRVFLRLKRRSRHRGIRHRIRHPLRNASVAIAPTAARIARALRRSKIPIRRRSTKCLPGPATGFSGVFIPTGASNSGTAECMSNARQSR